MTTQRLFAYAACGILILCLLLGQHPRWLEKMTGGTLGSMRWHHRLGILFLLLSGGHIGLVLKPYAPTTEDFLDLLPLLFSPDDPVFFFGTIGTLLVCALFPVSYATRLSFKTWRYQHLMMYVAALFIFLHMVFSSCSRIDMKDLGVSLTPSDVIVLPAIYLLGIILVLRIIDEKWPQIKTKFWTVKVIEKTSPAPQLALLTLQSTSSVDSWHPGDYGDFQFICHGNCHVSQRKHPFTILQVVPPSTLQMMIGSQGHDTKCLQHIEVGTQGRAFGPHVSSFQPILKDWDKQRRAHGRGGRPVLWIAGGAGMIPFLGLCYRWLEKPSPSFDLPKGFWSVLYLTDPLKEPYFLKDLITLQNKIPWLQFSHHAIHVETTADLQTLLAEIPHWRDCHIGITGPHGMNFFWTKTLRQMGFPRSRLYTEDTLCANI